MTDTAERIDGIELLGLTEHLREAEQIAFRHWRGSDFSESPWSRIRHAILTCRQQVADIAAGKE